MPFPDLLSMGLLDLVFFGTWLLVAVVALAAPDRVLRRVALCLLLSWAGYFLQLLPSIRAEPYPALGLVIDCVVFVALAAAACSQGSTWAILGAGMSFNLVLVSLLAWSLQATNPASFTPEMTILTTTLGRVWYYLAFAAVLFGALRAFSAARSAAPFPSGEVAASPAFA